ncbi:TIR domain-containing protein [Novosphingobium sp. JCM 18896]|uniref:TIR domain-containing protein n=1 Tax=Novosphingobium sp. JCM 18896 TaxID=2989731 RepID=UPI002222EB38|nr:TIR domain-containing protein [Novosphingobium sp. JCM 18896]MCW1429201.1 TIR domain-containing protein [Novosphingobium sp. JCM 18896]
MVDVFISYSRNDQAKVAVLARAVEAAGYKVWWDAELPPHESYGDVITDKIAHAKAAIVVWSPTAVKSEWVRAEADMARNQRKLIQTALDQVVPPLPFNQIQYAEIGDWQGEDDHPAWNKVKLSLATLCGAREGAEPPPVRPALRVEPQRVAALPQGGSRGGLVVGILVGAVVIALAVAGGIMLGRGSSEAPAPTPSAGTSAAVPVAATPAPSVAPEPVASVSPAVVSDGAEDAPSPPPTDMEFPDSSTRLLTAAEVQELGPTTLRVARNEIYARKGRRFADPWLREWFGRYAWYRPRFDQVELNAIEKQNVALIQQAEARYQ